SPVRHLGDHDAGSIAPVELADADRQSFGRKAFRSGGSKAVVAALAAQLAVWVTGWLVCFVKAAFLYIGLGIVLLAPGQDCFRVQRNGLTKISRQLLLQPGYLTIQETLQPFIG